MRIAVWLLALVALGHACASEEGQSSESSVSAGAAGGSATAPHGEASQPSAGTVARGAAPSAGRMANASAGTSAAANTASSASGTGGKPSASLAAGGGGGAVMASNQAGAPSNSAGSKAEGAAGAAGADSAAMTPPGEPKIPPIMGDCPMFASGTATIGGLRGITVQVGAMKAEKGPLLFYWHGTGQTAGMVNQSVPNDVRDEILDAGGIIISPSGSLGTGGDCSGTGTFYKDDFNVADLIVACGVRDHNIDPKRIYTTGCSAGGLHAGCMANMRASYLAAAAPNSGGIIGMQPKDDPHVPAFDHHARWSG